MRRAGAIRQTGATDPVGSRKEGESDEKKLYQGSVEIRQKDVTMRKMGGRSRETGQPLLVFERTHWAGFL